MPGRAGRVRAGPLAPEVEELRRRFAELDTRWSVRPNDEILALARSIEGRGFFQVTFLSR